MLEVRRFQESEVIMATPTTVNATTFARNFAQYQHDATREGLVIVTSNDRVVGGYLSADELERYRRLKARERKVYKTEDMPDDILEAIQNAEYGIAR
jgi:hypothetical protein